MTENTYLRTNRIHWEVIIGALAAILLLAGIAIGSDRQFILTGKLGYFFIHSL